MPSRARSSKPPVVVPSHTTDSDLVARMSALDSLGDTPEAEAERAKLRAAAEARGHRLVSIEISHEPMLDPDIDALPRAEREEILSVTRRIHDGERDGMIPVLEALISRHPRIPILLNLLSVVLQEAGNHERARRVTEDTVARFPTYVFAFCNHITTLLSLEKIDEARRLLETGPRGQLLMIALFDPSRTKFHFTEVIAYTATVGHYLIATGRTATAQTYLKMCRDIDPDHPQTIQLAQRLGSIDLITKAITRLSFPPRQRGGRPKKKGR